MLHVAPGARSFAPHVALAAAKAEFEPTLNGKPLARIVALSQYAGCPQYIERVIQHAAVAAVLARERIGLDTYKG